MTAFSCTTKSVTEASTCTDCYMYSHYGDESFSDYVTPEMEKDIRQGFDKLGEVLIGDHHGEYCTGDYGSCMCHETHFSWSPCDVCGSNLGGVRHDVDIVMKHV
jgi:hypothetical protein